LSDLGTRGKDCKHGDAKQGGGQKTCAWAKKLPKLTHEPLTGVRGYSQVHHLLCVGSVNGYHGDGKVPPHAKEKSIDKVYFGTPWCISHTTNLIRLPHKRFFLKLFVESKSLTSTQAPLLPCHDVDHGEYIQEVYEKICADVWDQVGEVQKHGQCFNESDAVAQFTSNQSHFRTELKTRGQAHVPDGDPAPGIHKVLAVMKKERAYNERDLWKSWWVPFSMAQPTIAMTRPIYDFYPVTNPDERTIQRRQRARRGP
jgi:hypothetical protein